MKIKIVSIHIENDLVNEIPTIVYTDENGIEWVHEEQSSHHGFITMLVKKEDSYYWKQ